MADKDKAVREFLEAEKPSVTSLKSFTKAQLLEVANSLEIENVKNTLRKADLQKMIAEELHENDRFTEGDLALCGNQTTEKVDIEMKLKLLEIEAREKEKEREEKEKERQYEMEKIEKERQYEREKMEKETEEKERLLKLELEQKEKEREFEREKMEKETEEKERLLKLELEEKEKEREFEREKIKEQRLIEERMLERQVEQTSKFIASREVRLVPPFHENEVDKYFQHFEKVAQSLKWPQEHWSLMLQSVIKGKAQQAYTALTVEMASDYQQVKQAILRAYELVPEAYRQKFRSLRKTENETHAEFAHNKELCFERWCTARKIDDNFQKLKNLILMEEFKRCVRDDVKTYLEEKETTTIQDAARLADEYSLIHKDVGPRRNKYSPRKGGNSDSGEGPEERTSSQNGTWWNSDSGEIPEERKSSSNRALQSDSGERPEERKVCNCCKKQGHVAAECRFNLNRKSGKEIRCFNCKKLGHIMSECEEFKDRKPIGLVRILTPGEEPGSYCPIGEVKPAKLELPEKNLLRDVSEGFVSTNENSTPESIRIFRDSGAFQSLLLRDALPSCDVEETATGEFVLCEGFNGSVSRIPLHTVFIKSNFVTGQVKVGLMSRLPFSGVSMLLGNDLADEEVNSSVQVKPSTADESSVDSEILPMGAVTRSMAKIAQKEDDSVQNSTSESVQNSTPDTVQNSTYIQHDTVVSDLSSDSDSSQSTFDLADTNLGSLLGQDQDNNLSDEKTTVSEDASLSKKQLVQEQKHDPDIMSVKDKELPDVEMSKVPVGYSERHTGIVATVRVVESTGDEDESHKEEFSPKPDLIPCKLPNSKVLEDLDPKLSHLLPPQQIEIKQLLLQNSDLFPDVPRRTSVTFHDVGEANLMKQQHKMNPDKCNVADKERT